MQSPLIRKLKQKIDDTHRCRAEHLETKRVCQKVPGGWIWTGDVYVFRVDHPDTSICYAWADDTGDSGERRISTMLARFAVTTPAAAVGEAVLREQLSERAALSSHYELG